MRETEIKCISKANINIKSNFYESKLRFSNYL